MSPTPQASMSPAGLLILTISVSALVSHASAFTICVVGTGLGLATPNCNVTADDPGQASYNGMEVEVFRAAATRAGWIWDPTPAGMAAAFSTKRFAFRCLANVGFTLLAPTLGQNFNTTQCHGMFGGMTQATNRMASSAYKASLPHSTTPNSVVVYDVDSSPPVDMWAFLKPLDYKLWVGFTATLLTLPFIIWTMEKLNSDGFIPLNKSSAVDLRFAVYRNIMAMFSQDIMFVTTLGAQLTMIAFLFLTFVTISTYTASLASFLTLTSAAFTANDLRDFADKPIAVYGAVGPFVQQTYGISNYTSLGGSATSPPIADLTLQTMELLKNKTYGAAFLPRVLIENSRALLNDCKFKIVGKDAEILFGSYFFHNTTPDAMVADFNTGLMIAQNQGLVDGLYREMYPSFMCPPEQAGAPVITWNQMLGLFIILYAALGGALIFTIVIYLLNLRAKVTVTPGEELPGDEVTSCKGSITEGSAATKQLVGALPVGLTAYDDSALMALPSDDVPTLPQPSPSPPTMPKGDVRPSSANRGF